MSRWTISLLTALLALTVATSGIASPAAPPGGEASAAKKKCKKGKGKKGAAAAKKCKRKKKKPPAQLPPASISLDPTSHSFGTIAVLSTASKVFTVTNAAGRGPTGSILITFSGSSASNYGVSENTCAAGALPGGQSCTFKVTFAPTGGTHNTTLIVSATPGGERTAEIYGSGSF